MDRVTNVRKGILISDVLYPILKIVIVAFILILVIASFAVVLSGGQNQLVEMFNKIFQWP